VIFYNPMDGDALTNSIPSKPRHCFLMTKLGSPISEDIINIRNSIAQECENHKYELIDASQQITGRDFLLKIWKLIAATPISIGICHEDIPPQTQANIYYEIGIAQALGKETVIIKSKKSKIPSDFIRTEYIEYNEDFKKNFAKFFETVNEQAKHYETVASLIDRNPVLSIDYLKRAFLITGDEKLRKKVQDFLNMPEFKERAKNSVELIAAMF
jgi:hypothetical protein